MARFSNDDDDWVELEGVVEHRSAKAMLFNGVNMDGPVWIPLSQMEIVESSSRPGALTTIKVKGWFAKKENLE